MHSEEEFELTAEERMKLAALPRETAPSDLLEERVVRALRREGHLGMMKPARSRGIGVALRIAAALALFAGGVATGRYLMMSDGPQSASRVTPIESRTRDTTPPGPSMPAIGTETAVAEREMWL